MFDTGGMAEKNPNPCPRMTQVMERNLIPWRQVIWLELFGGGRVSNNREILPGAEKLHRRRSLRPKNYTHVISIFIQAIPLE